KDIAGFVRVRDDDVGNIEVALTIGVIYKIDGVVAGFPADCFDIVGRRPARTERGRCHLEVKVWHLHMFVGENELSVCFRVISDPKHLDSARQLLKARYGRKHERKTLTSTDAVLIDIAPNSGAGIVARPSSLLHSGAVAGRGHNRLWL